MARQELRGWASVYARDGERLGGLLQNGTDLGDQAQLGVGQLDAVSECLTDALRHESGHRAAANRVALERLEGVAARGEALGRAIEAGR